MAIKKIAFHDYPLQKGTIFDFLSTKSLEIMVSAHEEALNSKQRCVTTLHLLLALCRSDHIQEFLRNRGRPDELENVARHTLEQGATHDTVQGAVLPNCSLPLSGRLQNVIKSAIDIILEIDQQYIRPQDLLVAILRHGANEAASLLTHMGISVQEIYRYFRYPQAGLWYRLKYWLRLGQPLA